MIFSKPLPKVLLSSLLLTAPQERFTNAAFNWLGCPSLPALQSADSDGLLTKFENLDYEKLSSGTWYEVLRDSEFETDYDCVAQQFNKYDEDPNGNSYLNLSYEYGLNRRSLRDVSLVLDKNGKGSAGFNWWYDIDY